MMRLLQTSLLLFWLPISAWALPSDRDQPINIEADHAQMDDASGVAQYKGDAILTQGTLRIEGDVITFYYDENKQLKKAVAEGKLATYKQVHKQGEEPVRAKALRMDYMAAEVGKLLAFLKEPEPPKGMKDAWDKLPIFRQVLNMGPKVVKNAPCQQQVIEGDAIDLSQYPIQHCWPEDAAPLITWGLVVTKGPHKTRQNLGIYRQQVIGKNRVIMRWLSHPANHARSHHHRRRSRILYT